MITSVALCTYNAEKFLHEQLQSILNQTVSVNEIVVCDDNSTDTTLEILKGYQQNYPSIFKIFKNLQQLGSIKNFEKAITLCTGDIIFLSDQDDVWLPNKVEVISETFANHSFVNCIATNGFIINEKSIVNNNVLTIWEVPKILKDHNISLNFFKSICCFNNFITGATMAFKRELINEITPFPNYKKLMHHDEWIALHSSYKKAFMFLNEKLIKYRVHSNQQVGGITYDNSFKRQQYFLNIFDENSTSPIIYKRKLKLLTKNYYKILEMKNENLVNQFFLDQILIVIKENYQFIDSNFKKEAPFLYYLRRIIDFLKKRKKLKNVQ